MFLTKHRKMVLDLQKDSHGSRKLIALHSEAKTGKYISPRHMHSNNTAVFNDIKEALETLKTYYPLFERRAVKNSDELKTLLNGLSRQISKSVKEKK